MGCCDVIGSVRGAVVLAAEKISDQGSRASISGLDRGLQFIFDAAEN